MTIGDLFEPFAKKIPIENSSVKQLKNIDVKELEDKDAGHTSADTVVDITSKVIRSIENKGIFLKETTRKINSLKGGFLNFLKPLMTAGLPLMKHLLTPSPKSVLVPSGLTTAASVTDAVIQKKILGWGNLRTLLHVRQTKTWMI